jgi:excisionase family DNA binding protein
MNKRILTSVVGQAVGEAEADPRQAVLEGGFVGVEEARRYLCVSRTLLYSLMDGGQLAYAKIGKCRRIPRKALIAYAESRLVMA